MRLVFLTEERSMKELLLMILPKFCLKMYKL